MPRYFYTMSVEEFGQELYALCRRLGSPRDDLRKHINYHTGKPYTDAEIGASGIRDLLCEGQKLTKVRKDLSKIEFDWENCEAEDYPGQRTDFMGINVLPNGMPYLGMLAGGDWEVPVYFIVYHYKGEFRGYIPKDGNTYNLTTKTAYGNDDDEDQKDAKKRGIDDPYDLKPDYDKLRADIMARIRPAAEQFE